MEESPVSQKERIKPRHVESLLKLLLPRPLAWHVGLGKFRWDPKSVKLGIVIVWE